MEVFRVKDRRPFQYESGLQENIESVMFQRSSGKNQIGIVAKIIAIRVAKKVVKVDKYAQTHERGGILASTL